MAKKRVNFAEQHLEKGVVGITAIALLGVAFLYLVKTPNVIEENGENFGPGDYDKKVLLVRVENVKKALISKPSDPDPIPDYVRRFKKKHETGVSSGRLAQTWTSVQPWRPTVPPAVGTKPKAPDQILLTRVVPPQKPVVMTGLSTFKDVPVEAIDSDDEFSEDEWDDLLERDRSWVTVFATFDLEAQKDEYRRAEYDLERFAIIVGQVRLQRQVQLSGGQWDKWEDAKTWTSYQPVRPPELELIQQNDGYKVKQKQLVKLKRYHELLEVFQPELKQPPPPYRSAGNKWCLAYFPDINWCTLDIDAAGMAADDEEDGCNPYLAEFAKCLPPDAEGKSKKALTPTEQKRQNRLKAARQMKEIKLLIKAGTYPDLIEAERLISEVKKNPDAPRRVKVEADKLYARILPDIEEMYQKMQSEEDPDEPDATAPLDQSHTVVWAHDIPVKAGHVYRYRIAVDLYNTYVDQYDKLKDMDAASSVFVRGEWSEPSDPVEVAPESAFFVSRVDGENVRIDIYKWFRGRVFNQRIDIQPGQPIADRDFVKIKGLRGRKVVDYDTGYVLLAAEESKKVRVRETVGRDGGFQYSEESAPSIYAVDADGNVVERNKLLDQTRQRRWSAMAKK